MKDLLQYNYALTTSLLSWITAQVIKTVLYLIKHKKLSLERLTGAGGMPSAHSAVVCSLVISTVRTEGIASTTFAIVFAFAFVVMYDAMGVRRAAGLHAREINKLKKLIKEFDDELQDELDEKIDIYLNNSKEMKDLKEFLGHTPIEVLGGALLGIILTLLLPIAL